MRGDESAPGFELRVSGTGRTRLVSRGAVTRGFVPRPLSSVFLLVLFNGLSDLRLVLVLVTLLRGSGERD